MRAPELTAAGLKLVGGRLLPGPTGPASFLMYESASGERFTIYTAKSEAEATQMRYSAQGNESALFWADRGVAYVVSGVGDRGRLTQIAQSVYDQMEKTGGLSQSEPRSCRCANVGQAACPNSDIENLESRHRRVSLSHRVITRK